MRSRVPVTRRRATPAHPVPVAGSRTRRSARLAAVAAVSLATGALAAIAPGTAAHAARPVSRHSASHLAPGRGHPANSSSTVWLCRPGTAPDPCAASLTTTVVDASGSTSVAKTKIALASRFDCFYVYPTVSSESAPNADLRVRDGEIAAAVAQASRFSAVCRVWAPMYHQITAARLFALPLLTATSPPVVTAYHSLRAGFEDYLKHDNDGRPIIFLGHSQGAAMLIRLLQHLVDNNPTLRKRLVLAIILGGNVVVRTGSSLGGSFGHIPLCTTPGEVGCVIAYSSFPGEPPSASLFGRPGQGVSVLAGQSARRGVHVACVNPAAIAGGSGPLAPFFPSEGKLPTPWVEYPHLYTVRCDSAGGATWLQVTKVSATSDRRPVVTEVDGADWGYHTYDVNLALGNLLADTAAAEAVWSRQERH